MAKNSYSVKKKSKSVRKTMPSFIKTVTIHRRGDVVLINDDPATKCFLVNSDRLEKGSGVFRAMLSGRYAETNYRATGDHKIVTIRLHDDDQEALELLLKMMHFAPRLFVKDLSPELFYELAILVDKYNCGHILPPTIKICLNRVHSKFCGTTIMEIPACALLAGAAAGLGLHSCFRRFTTCLAKGADGEIKKLLEEESVFLGSRPLSE